jgi:hypothetical protein
MARIRNRRSAPAAAIDVGGSTRVDSVMLVQIKVPVWLYTHKAQRGDVVTVDPELGLRLIENGQADAFAG